MDTVIDWYETHRQDVRLVSYLLLTLVPAVYLADMLTRALAGSGLRVTLNELFALVSRNSLTLAAFLFGLYLGFLVLLYIDFKKRAQSLILSIVTGITIVIFALNGRFLPNMDGIDFAFMLLGLLLGIIVAGGPKLHYLELHDARALARGRVVTKSGRTPLEFRSAERYLYGMLISIIAVGFIEAHVDYPPLFRLTGESLVIPLLEGGAVRIVDTDIIAQDLVAVLLFSIALYLFLGYDSDTRLFILGPSRSGKTHVPIGMFLAANNSDLHVWGAEKGLTRLIREMRSNEDFAGATEGVQDIGFNYATTGYFPRNVNVDALDYPGEYLPHIPDGLRYLRREIPESELKQRIAREIETGEAIKDSSTGSQQGLADGGASQAPNDPSRTNAPDQQQSEHDSDPFSESESLPDDDVIDLERSVETRFVALTEEILPRIRSADTLLLILDMERAQHDERLYTSYYNEVVNELQVVGDSSAARLKGFIGQETTLGPLKAEKVVATKSDFLLDDVDMTAPQVMNSYETFRRQIYNTTQNDIEIGPLLNSLEDAPYPVFFKGKDHDRYELEFGPDGSPILFGFRELLNRISR